MVTNNNIIFIFFKITGAPYNDPAPDKKEVYFYPDLRNFEKYSGSFRVFITAVSPGYQRNGKDTYYKNNSRPQSK